MKKNLSRSLFLIPALALMAVFVVYPVVNTIYLSLLTPSGDFAPIANYVDVLGKREVVNIKGFSRGFPLGALPHNLLWIVIHLPVTTFLGLILAVLMRNVKGGAIVKSIIFLGMVIPMIIGGLIVRFMFDEYMGVVPAFLSIFGVAPQSWTTYPETALFALILGSIWLWTGFSMVLYSAGLGTIPENLYEAAEVDGANKLQQFFYITLPQLRNTTIFVVLATTILAFKLFTQVEVMTKGGPQNASMTTIVHVVHQGWGQLKVGYASAISIAFFLIVLSVSLLQRYFLREERAVE